MNSYDPKKYSIRIEAHYDEDKKQEIFHGFVAEIKNIYTEAKTADHAYKQVLKEIKIYQKHCKEHSIPIFPPLCEQKLSGKLNFRLGPELHKKIALEAASVGISINQYLIKKVMI